MISFTVPGRVPSSLRFTCKTEKIEVQNMPGATLATSPGSIDLVGGQQRMVKCTLRREWREAIEKVHREGRCRVCGTPDDLQAAHTIGRRWQDVEVIGPRGGAYLLVKADAVVPLCRWHHELYDARQLDLLPYLHLHEQVYAVETAGGVLSMLKRVSPLGGSW